MLRDYILVSKAVADEVRIRILKLLEKSELCVCQIMAVIGLGQSTVSKHLGILKNAGLVECRHAGTWVYYRLADSNLNTYNLHFLKLVNQCLNDDQKIKADAERLKDIIKIEPSNLCNI
jgi:DNA-binding transcriptional ArsR family regulator